MEKEILKIFTKQKNLRFKEIERLLKVRSNKLAYHIKKLLNRGIITKSNNQYYLSESAEKDIPYITEKRSVIPVIIIHIGNNKEAYLYKRNKRPYENYLSLPGGRLLVGESIEKAARRIAISCCSINIKDIKVKRIILEHVKEFGKIKYSFLLIVIKAKLKKNLPLYKIKNKRKIIPSDYKIIKEDLQSNLSLKTIFSYLR